MNNIWNNAAELSFYWNQPREEGDGRPDAKTLFLNVALDLEYLNFKTNLKYIISNILSNKNVPSIFKYQ